MYEKILHIICHQISEKKQHNTTTHLLEWPKSRTLMLMLVRMWHNRNSLSLTVGMQNGRASSEDYLEVSYNVKMLLKYNSAILLLGILAKFGNFLCTSIQNLAYRCLQKFYALLLKYRSNQAVFQQVNG